MSTPKTIALVISAVLFSGMLSGAAHAQAWVGVKGTLSVAVDYTYAPSSEVVEDDGITIPGAVANHSVNFAAEYTPIENLAFQATIPLLTTIYKGADGDASFQPHGRYDDGNYHPVLQDFRLNGRYMVLDAPVAISPHVGVSVPMTDYETVGYAGAGRGLKQLHLGVSIGKFFTSGIPNLYLHGSYEFSLVESYETPFPETAEYGQNKSDIKGLVGYFITDNLEVNAAFDWRNAHGGFEFLDFQDVSPVVQWHHDGLLAEDFLLLGGGLSYQATEQLRLISFFRMFLQGKNTRDLNVFGGGLSWDLM